MASSMAASSFSNWGLLVLFLIVFPAVSASPICESQKFTNNRVYVQCLDLPSLESYLHWTYDSANSSLSIAFVASPPEAGGWVSWAVNPTGTGMVGSQALVAYLLNGVPTVKTYNVASYGTVLPSNLSFEVWDTGVEFKAGVMEIFAKLKLPNKATQLNQVWQVGPFVSGTILGKHDFESENLNSRGILTLTADGGGGITTIPTVVNPRTRRKNIHGVLNAVSWGFLFPLGIIIARYLRSFPSTDPAWFYLHISCQISAYAIGAAGWWTGLNLGSESKGYTIPSHRNIGIALFTMATLQMFALFIRPKKDHKYRIYWNIYHQSIGYSIVILGMVNIFKGLNILNPDKIWKSSYIYVICGLGGLAFVLEIITWIVVLKRKKSNKSYETHSNNPPTRQQIPLAF